MLLSIIIPVFNEISYLKRFSNRLFQSFQKYEVEYIFINDGSDDGSDEWLSNIITNNKEKNIKYISYRKNKGKGHALREGLKKSTGNFILFQDSDLELDTNDSKEMFEIIKKNKDMKVIFGTRFFSGKLKRHNKLIYLLAGKLNSLIFNIFYAQSISDVHCGTKIITKEVKDKINLKINDFGFEIDIASQIVKNNFQIYEYGISYVARTREQGKKITWVDGIKSIYYLIKTRFIDNEFSVFISIIFASFYMSFIGSYFSLGIGKIIVIVILFVIGCFIGLHNKLLPSAIILIFSYFGSLFSSGNGKIITVALAFFIGIFLSKKIKSLLDYNSRNRFIKFFV